MAALPGTYKAITACESELSCAALGLIQYKLHCLSQWNMVK